MEIEDLAVMVKGGFDDMGTRISGLENRINSLEARVDTGFTHMGHRIDALETRVSYMASSRSKDMERAFEWLKELDERVNTLEDNAVGVK